MKKLFTTLFLILNCCVFGQNIETCNIKLKDTYLKLKYFASYYDSHDYSEDVSISDSLSKYNAKLEKLLLQFTASNSETLTYTFKELIENGMDIATSEDGLFRIYSWNTLEGGTMRIYKNVFQYKDKNQLYSKVFPPVKGQQEGYYFYQINDIVSENKKFYVAQGTSVGGTYIYFNKVKIFSIDKALLNDKALLIKTKSGIRNELGYEVNLGAYPNRERKTLPDYEIQYDTNNKIISIPVILEDYKITDKRIKYQFKGKYFEKL